jgi:transposase InsO family protein
MHLVSLIGISRSKYYDWRRRYGKENEHNSWIPRDFWLEEWEKEAIIEFSMNHPLDGYRRLTYMMLDNDIVAVSPSSVYRVLKGAGLLVKWNRKASRKGAGFTAPIKAHEHWHIDISYLNICGTFYYLCSVLDGYSRYIVHWEIRESMTERDVETIVQRSLEKYPGACPRIISDNGPQFIAKDFKEFIRISGMSHVKTSPYYPQSNGKIERWHQTLKNGCIRPQTPLSLEDARHAVEGFVQYYNDERLHSAIQYITPKDKLEGRARDILKKRDAKLDAARRRRKQRRQQLKADSNSPHLDSTLTKGKSSGIISSAGKTEAGSAGEQPARDSRSGYDEHPSRGVVSTPRLFTRATIGRFGVSQMP